MMTMMYAIYAYFALMSSQYHCSYRILISNWYTPNLIRIQAFSTHAHLVVCHRFFSLWFKTAMNGRLLIKRKAQRISLKIRIAFDVWWESRWTNLKLTISLVSFVLPRRLGCTQNLDVMCVLCHPNIFIYVHEICWFASHRETVWANVRNKRGKFALASKSLYVDMLVE